MEYYFALWVNFYDKNKIQLDPIEELYVSDYASVLPHDCDLEISHLLGVIERSDFDDIWQREIDVEALGWNADNDVNLNLNDVGYISLSIEKFKKDDTDNRWVLCETVFETPLHEVGK